MLGVLEAILCVLKNILLAILFAGLKVVDLVLDAIQAGANAAFSLLPTLPDLPQLPPAIQNVSGFVAYFVPLEQLTVVGLTLLAGWLVFMVVRIPLKWAKAL